MIEKISADKYTMTKNDILIDLRESRLFSFGSIEGAVNIPADDIVKLYSLPKDKRIVLSYWTITAIRWLTLKAVTESGLLIA